MELSELTASLKSVLAELFNVADYTFKIGVFSDGLVCLLGACIEGYRKASDSVRSDSFEKAGIKNS